MRPEDDDLLDELERRYREPWWRRPWNRIAIWWAMWRGLP